MRSSIITVLTGVALAVGPVAALGGPASGSAPAGASVVPSADRVQLKQAKPAKQAKKAKVTLKKLPAQKQAGKKVGLSGKAAKRAVVVVQRRYAAGGGWQRVARVKANAKGVWRAKVKLTRGGTTAFRAKAGRAASPKRSMKVYQWIYLTRQPHLGEQSGVYGFDVSIQMAGRTTPHSYFVRRFGMISVRTGGACTKFDMTVGFLDESPSQIDGDEIAGIQIDSLRADRALLPSWPTHQIPASQGSIRARGAIAPGTASMTIWLDLTDPDLKPIAVGLAGPRLLCNATGLSGKDIMYPLS